MGGLFTGYVTSRQWFDPVPVEYLFHDRHHFAECVIEHEELHILKAKMNEGGFNFAQTKDKSDLQRELQNDDDKEESAKFIKIKPQIN